MVLLVLVAAGACCLAGRRGLPRSRRAGLATACLLLLTVLAWLPPLLQEATTAQGNLTKLTRFFTSPPPPGLATHGLPEAVTAVSRALTTVWLFDRPDGLSYLDWSVPNATWSASALFGTAVTVAVAAALAAVGLRLRDRFAAALGASVAVGLVVAVVSVERIVGPLSAYLVIWLSALPVVLVIGWASVATRLARTRLPPRVVDTWPARLAPPIALTLTAALAAAVAPAAVRATQQVGPCCDSTAAADAAATIDALVPTLSTTGDPGRNVLVGIDPSDTAAWSAATPMLLAFTRHGWHASFTPAWAALDEVPSASWEPVEVLLTAPGQPLPAGYRPFRTIPYEDQGGGTTLVAVEQTEP